MPHEDKSNKIEMLRKIECELNFMSEKRDYIASKPKVSLANNPAAELEALEVKVDKERKERRRINLQEKDE